MKAVVFSGTTEGRVFSRQLAALGAEVLVSVATLLGAEEQGEADGITVHCGRLTTEEMTALLQGAALCVDEIGNIIRPNYVSEQFPKLLEKNGLRPIRFHDLRHSCASLLLANGVPMKQIQEWLGHSDFSTTANIYAHLDYASKLSSAQAMLEGLGYGNASA